MGFENDSDKDSTKTCTKCKVGYEATPENFPSAKRNKDGLSSWCRSCSRAATRKRQAIYSQTPEGKATRKRYCGTINGDLHRKFDNITDRCSKNKSYIRKGIMNLFESVEDLIDYVVDVLQVNPIGLQCHRIDNDGHYEPGNIEFLTKIEHDKIHVEMRKSCAV
jgi:hypothetical protein